MLPDPFPLIAPLDDAGRPTEARRRVLRDGERLTVPLMLTDGATADLARVLRDRFGFQGVEASMSTTTTNIADAMIQDAATRISDAVRGLPPEEAQQVMNDAIMVAALRAHDRRMKAASTPRQA